MATLTDGNEADGNSGKQLVWKFVGTLVLDCINSDEFSTR